MTNTPATADQVAELYGVGRTTVYRWVDDGQFDPGVVTRMKSPSGERDRVLFDRDAVAQQFETELLSAINDPEEMARDSRYLRVKEFLNG